MKTSVTIAVVSICALIVLGATAASAIYVDENASLAATSDEGFVVDLMFDQPDLTPKHVRHGQPVYQVKMHGLGYDVDPGRAMLPVKGFLFGLPPDGDYTFAIEEIETTAVAGAYVLFPSPTYPPAEGVNTGCKNVCGPLAERTWYDEAFYASDAPYPGALVERGLIGYVREQRVGQLRVHPVQYIPATGEVRYVEHLRVRVRFDSSLSIANGPVGPEAGSLAERHEGLLRSTLINYPESSRWPRADRRVAARRIDLPEKSKALESVKIRVVETGIHRVTYDDLDALGIGPAAIDPATFQLFNRGVELPILVDGESDGVFDPTDSILFWGEPLKDRYSYANVYVLTNSVTAGLRMGTLDGTPGGAPAPAAFLDTAHFEENNHWFPGHPEWETTEIWEWVRLTAPQSTSVTFDLENLSPLARTATLRVRLVGRSTSETTPNHHTKIFLNGTEVDDLYWSGQGEFTHEVGIPMNDLIEGENVLTVTAPGDTGAPEDAIYLNWFEVDAWKTFAATEAGAQFAGETDGQATFTVTDLVSEFVIGFDVTDPADPLVIENAAGGGSVPAVRFTFQALADADSRFAVLPEAAAISPYALSVDDPSDLTDSANGADYLIVTDPAFAAQAQDLADYRATDGLRTAVVYAEDIYDEFNDGIPDPGAIVDFLAYAYGNWTAPAMTYVMLIGDTHPDYNDYLNTTKPNHVPSLLIDSPNMGATPSDVPYSLLAGDDPLPDVFLGRIPAETPADAQAMIDKAIEYEAAPLTTWHEKAVFVADNNFPTFAEHSETLIDLLPAAFASSRMFLGFQDPDVLRAAIKGEFNAGALLVTYQGHGWVDNWTGERAFTAADALTLATGSKYNFVLTFSCLNGYFPLIETDRLSISEAFLFPHAGGGSIGSLAPIGYTIRAENEIFSEDLFEELFVNDDIEIGSAIAAAKITAIGGGVGYEIVNLYHLLGDPALDLKIDTNATLSDDDDYETSPTTQDADADDDSGDDEGCGDSGRDTQGCSVGG